MRRHRIGKAKASTGYDRFVALGSSVTLSKEGGLAMDFRPLNDTERQKLIDALRGNAQSNLTILMSQRDTSFVGATEEVTDEEVISAIKSVPCHY